MFSTLPAIGINVLLICIRLKLFEKQLEIRLKTKYPLSYIVVMALSSSLTEFDRMSLDDYFSVRDLYLSLTVVLMFIILRINMNGTTCWRLSMTQRLSIELSL